MSRSYNVWTESECEALREGVSKHGLGSWEIIRRDPDLPSLAKRSGVQLKDKWRNLVKFRHITVEESRTLKPKSSGPWSRKLSACASKLKRSSSQTPTGSRRTSRSGGEEEHAAMLLALESGKAEDVAVKTEEPSGRDAGQVEAGEASSSADDQEDNGGRGMGSAGDEEDGGMSAGQSRKRRLHEDRRFGIYDQRRYGPGGSMGDLAMEAGPGSGRSKPRGRRRSKSLKDLRDGMYSVYDSDGSDDDSDFLDDEDDEGHENGQRSQKKKRSATLKGGGRKGGSGVGRRRGGEKGTVIGSGRSAALGQRPSGKDGIFFVSCSCGTTFDDGALMIECQSCSVWAHLSCLEQQVESDPLRYAYDFKNYMCEACQMGCGGPGLYYQNAAFQAAGSIPMNPNGNCIDPSHGQAVAAEQRRPRRERKASTRYQGDEFAPLSDTVRGGEGADRDREESGGGGSQHSSKSSRDKTNEAASTLILGLAKSAGTAGDILDGAVLPPSGKARTSSGLRRAGGRNSTDAMMDADQLELFLTHSGGGGNRGGIAEGPSAAHYHFSRNSGGYPARTSSPATAALAAAAALAMKEHEAEMRAKANASGRSGSGPNGASGGDNGLPSDPLEALFPATGGIDPSITRRTTAFAPRPQQHPALARKASISSLQQLQGAAQCEVGGTKESPLSPGGVNSLLGIGGSSVNIGRSSVNGVSGIEGGAIARPRSSNGHPSLSHNHHQHLLASLGLDGRHSPFTAALGAIAAGHRGSPALQNNPHLAARMAVMQNGFSPKGSTGNLMPLHNMFGESDDEGSLGLLAIDSLRSDPNFLGGLLSNGSIGGSRAPTPASQFFLDTLMRATPDFLGIMGSSGGTSIGGGLGRTLSDGAEDGALRGLPSGSATAAASTEASKALSSSLVDRPGSTDLPQFDPSSTSQQYNSAFQAARSSSAAPGGELAGLLAAATVRPGSATDIMLQGLLRPGTPDAWALLRGSTPTPSEHALLSGMGLGLGGPTGPGLIGSSGTLDSMTAAASWLLMAGGRVTPLPPPAANLPPSALPSATVTVIDQSTTEASGGAEPGIGSAPSGGAEPGLSAPSSHHHRGPLSSFENHLDASEAPEEAGMKPPTGPVNLRAMSSSPSPAVLPVSAGGSGVLVRPVASRNMLPSQVLEQAVLHAQNQQQRQISPSPSLGIGMSKPDLQRTAGVAVPVVKDAFPLAETEEVTLGSEKS